MHMIGNAAGAITFAPGVSRNRREILVQVGAHGRFDAGTAVFGAEYSMDDDETQGLRHGDGSCWLFDGAGNYGSGFQPFATYGGWQLGRCPRLVWGGPLALGQVEF